MGEVGKAHIRSWEERVLHANRRRDYASSRLSTIKWSRRLDASSAFNLSQNWSSVVSLKYFQHHSGVSSHEQVARSDQSNRSPHGGGVVEPGPCLVGSDVQSSAGEATFSKHSLCPTPPSPHKARAYQAQRSPKWPFFLVTSSHLRPQAHTGQGWCLPTFSGAS